MKYLLIVALGGSMGAVMRFLFAQWLAAERFPLATFTVNVLGSLLIGMAYVLIDERFALHDELRHLLIVGMLGAFTTYSSFSLDTIKLLEAGHGLMALSYVIATLCLCFFSTWLGILLCRALYSG